MSDDPNKHSTGCPLTAVHQRLEHLHRHWHAAEAAYFDPDGFRVAIQTAIQTARTVSFILQSNKAVIPQFNEWYTKWQDEFRGNPLMRWMVEARNRIEKQGDLETNSFVRAEIIASHLNEGPYIEVPAKLFDAPLKLVKSIPDNALGRHIKRDGVVRIHRRWVENSLPEYELLEAVALTYGNLRRLLDDAHRQIGLPLPESRDIKSGELYDSESMGGRMPCMVGHSDRRTLDVWLATGIPVKFERISKSVSRKEAEKRNERYGLNPKEIFGVTDTPEGILDGLFATARVMMAKDGYHVTIMFMFKGKRMLQILELRPEEHGQKYMMMRDLAHDLVRKGADAAILIGEIWGSTYSQADPYRRAADAPDREEALSGTLVSKEGDPVMLYARILRTSDGVALDDTERLAGGAHFMFAPFYEAWGRDIPQEWMQQEQALRSGDTSERG